MRFLWHYFAGTGGDCADPDAGKQQPEKTVRRPGRHPRPEPVPFYRNKIYIALIAVLLFVVGGYLVAKGSINLGRQQGYQPSQPIYYSHKVHVGINQINCLYCHGPPGKASMLLFRRSTFA
jgi:hypothetical protein